MGNKTLLREQVADYISCLRTFFNNIRQWFKSPDGMAAVSYLALKNPNESCWSELINNDFDLLKPSRNKSGNYGKKAVETLLKCVPLSRVIKDKVKKTDISRGEIIPFLWEALERGTKESGYEPAWLEVAYDKATHKVEKEKYRPYESFRVGVGYLGKIVSHDISHEARERKKYKMCDFDNEIFPEICGQTDLTARVAEMIRCCLTKINKQGVSKKRIAKELNFDRSFLYAILKGKKKFPARRMQILLEFILNLPPQIRAELQNSLDLKPSD